MELPVKYILLGTNPLASSYIFEIKIIPITNELQLNFNFYELKTKLTTSLMNSINSNDSNVDYIDKLPKALLCSRLFSVKEAEGIAFNLNSKVPNLGTLNPNSVVKIQIADISLDMFPFQIYSLYIFVQQFVISYNLYKFQYFSSIPQQPIQQTITPPEQINRPILSIVEKQEVKNDIPLHDENLDLIHNDTEIDENLFEVGLTQALNLCDNTYLQYYLTKYINVQLNNNQIEEEFDIDIKNGVLYLTFEQLLPNGLLLFSQKHYEDLLLIIKHLSISNEEIRSKLQFCLDQIVLLCNKYLEDKEKYKTDVHILLQIYEYVFFIYNLKFNPEQLNKVLETQYKTYGFIPALQYIVQTVLNSGITAYSQRYSSLPYNKIELNHPQKVHYTNIDLEHLKNIVKNNKYILNLQNNEVFIEKVIVDLEKVKEEESFKSKKQVLLNYESQKLIDVNNLITDNSKLLKSNNLLQYSLIDISNYPILKNKKVLSKEYLELLLLQLKDPNLKSSELTNLVKNYSQLIITDILIPLSDNYKNLKQPVSSIDLLLNHIRPVLNENSSINLELEILYRVIIPFLYDNFNITEFIDCFH